VPLRSGADVGGAIPDIAVDSQSGALYLVWEDSRFSGTHDDIAFSKSTDEGKTWSTPIQVNETTNGATAFTPSVDVSSDGTVAVSYYDWRNNTSAAGLPVDYFIVHSHDGGSTWGPATTIARPHGTEPGGIRTGSLQAAAVDPATGALLVVWQDARFYLDGRNDIVISISDDEGATWSRPRPVTPATRRRDAFTPAIAAAGGIVDVTYANVRLGPSGHPTHGVSIRYQASTDGGRHFSAPMRLDPRGDLRYAAVDSLGEKFLGDYMGLAPTADGAVAVWCRPFAEAPDVSTAPRHQAAWAIAVRA
jgi:hypothetical protein